MKTFGSYFIITIITIVIFGALYPLAMTGLGSLISPDGAKGKPLYRGETLVGYENIGQSFTSEKYFWGRPSAVDYNAAATGGSNYGNGSPELLALIQERTNTIMASNPGISKADIPVELVTASGSGLDPHISERAAMLQVNRIAKVRNISEEDLKSLISENKHDALLGIFGPKDIVNVLKLNIALDELTNSVAHAE